MVQGQQKRIIYSELDTAVGARAFERTKREKKMKCKHKETGHKIKHVNTLYPYVGPCSKTQVFGTAR